MANDDFAGWLIAAYSMAMLVSVMVQVISVGRNRILREFCAEVDGASVRGCKAEVRHRSWSIVVSMGAGSTTTGQLDERVSTLTTEGLTRVTVSYFPTDDFRFRIYPTGGRNRPESSYGMRHVDIGDPSFDSLFIVQASDEAKLHELLGNPAIRELMRREPRLSVARRADNRWFFRMLPDEMDELHLEVDERIEDVDRLRSLTLLASEILEELVSIGSASEDGSGPSVVQ